jgi:phage gpG-like protein
MSITSRITEKGYTVVITGLGKIDAAVINGMRLGLERGLLKTVGVVQREYLQGPRPAKLGEITARLRNSISSKVTVSGDKVTGRIGTNVSYGAYHEFGFHGTENVRQFNRVISRTFRSQGSIGSPIQLGGKFEAGARSGGKKAARSQRSGAVTFEFVKAHTRKVDYAGRPFVAPALQKSLPMILAEIKKDLAAIKPI